VSVIDSAKGLTDTSDPRHFGTSPKVSVTLAPKHFGTETGHSARTVRTVGPDTSVLGHGHFGKMPKCPATATYGSTSPRQCGALIKDFMQCTH